MPNCAAKRKENTGILDRLRACRHPQKLPDTCAIVQRRRGIDLLQIVFCQVRLGGVTTRMHENHVGMDGEDGAVR